MRLLYNLFACVGALATASPLAFTDTSWTVVSEVPFDLSWRGNTGVVNIIFASGSTTSPTYVNSIATNINANVNALTWTPGNLATPGKTFFIVIIDSTGAQAVSDKFVVAVSGSSSTTGSTATQTPSSASTTTSKSPSKTTKPSQHSSSGISSGAKAGIGIGVALGAVLGIALVAVGSIFWRRKYKAVPGSPGAGGGTSGPSEKKGFFGFGSKKARPKTQLREILASDATGGGVHELDGTVRHEMQ